MPHIPECSQKRQHIWTKPPCSEYIETLSCHSLLFSKNAMESPVIWHCIIRYCQIIGRWLKHTVDHVKVIWKCYGFIEGTWAPCCVAAEGSRWYPRTNLEHLPRDSTPAFLGGSCSLLQFLRALRCLLQPRRLDNRSMLRVWLPHISMRPCLLLWETGEGLNSKEDRSRGHCYFCAFFPEAQALMVALTLHVLSQKRFQFWFTS